MRTRLFASLIIGALAAAAHPLAAETRSPVFAIDPARSIAQFTITKLGYEDVTGTFKESYGEVRWLPSEPAASSVRWRVKVASVVTGATNRDKTLQSEEYFNASRHPELIFESTRVRAIDARSLEVTGNLTMRGVTRPITITVRHNGEHAAPIFETDFEVNRHDYGIVGGSIMGRLIGRTARIHLRLVTKEHTL
jgi:polyisoprenoid-binding protein YceI